MQSRRSAALRVGWILLAVSAVGPLAAAIAILTNIADLTTRSSRHAFAGALGLTALAILQFILAVIPIRRGEKWALVATGVPFVVVGVPVLFVDATNVAPERVWPTIAPQLLGLLVGGTGCALCMTGMGRPRAS
ncbi:MAG TPA: hypothetical protein VKB50_29985 [Vicinamibacterales bacterium]|nr:hypothetical protein [Vicinamibacterales bacterium]